MSDLHSAPAGVPAGAPSGAPLSDRLPSWALATTVAGLALAAASTLRLLPGARRR